MFHLDKILEAKKLQRQRIPQKDKSLMLFRRDCKRSRYMQYNIARKKSMKIQKKKMQT